MAAASTHDTSTRQHSISQRLRALSDFKVIDRCSIAASTPLFVAGQSQTQPQPIRFGAAFDAGALTDGAIAGRLESTSGQQHPTQLTPLAYWADGSIKSLRVDSVFSSDYEGSTWRLVAVKRQGPGERPQSDSDIACGIAQIRLSETPAQRADHEAATLVLNSRIWELADRHGTRQRPEFSDARCVASGPVCATFEQSGVFPTLPGLRIETQWTVYPKHGFARCDITLHNSKRARHPGGTWDLGDSGSVFFEGFECRLALPRCEETETALGKISGRLQLDEPSRKADDLFAVYQDSSGGENWQSANHVNSKGINPCRFRGYQATVDRQRLSGLRAEPQFSVATSELCIAAAIPEFWQQFPKGFRATKSHLELGLFPREWGDLHELQGGERKRHTFWLKVSKSEAPVTDLYWVHDPVVVASEPAACANAGGVGGVRPQSSHAYTRFQTVLSEAFSEDRGVLANQEQADEYGWRNYGDTIADHEQVYYEGPAPFVSHYNNQFDVLLGFLLQFLRTSDPAWFRRADALARHVMDIDIYHTTEDKAAYNGGLFWFTDHYLTAHTSTHRTYSRHNAAAGHDYGGGPGAEHNYSGGLRLYHLLTGCPYARQAVVGLADWVIRMEDGRRTILGVLDESATGAATVGLAKPSRGGANSIGVLLDAWSLTNNRAYLSFAEELIRRCIHPDDDVEAHDLLNAEKNWSYTMFLTSLARYLAEKEEAEELDSNHSYAKASLGHYAAWMLEHERPYFDQSDRLEYPTEAWACQEFRKANVFRRAARYADPGLAEKLRAKGEEFGDRAWNDLMRFEETRTTIRALALIMTEGLADCVFRGSPLAVAVPDDEWEGRFSPRQPFVDQKSRVRALAKTPAGAVKLLARAANPARWARWLRDRNAPAGGGGR